MSPEPQSDIDNRTYVRYDGCFLPPWIQWDVAMGNPRNKQELIHGMDAVHSRICAQQDELFGLIAQADRAELWRGTRAKDMAHWLSLRYGISRWKALRWIEAALALESLPRLSHAFASGELGIDKVVELTRFATPQSEERLVEWAQGVCGAAIRRRADREARTSVEELRGVEESRFVSWWYFDDGKRFGLEADLPAAQGAVVARALDRLADALPVMPGEEDYSVGARRADALVALASMRVGADPDPDRATVVVHAQLEGLVSGDGGAEIEGGPVIHPETARRLACNARIQMVIEDKGGQPLRLGRIHREPSAAMLRQLKYRDGSCTFPGCGARRFTQAHHIVWWERGGSTDLDNLGAGVSVPPPAGARVRVGPQAGPCRHGAVVRTRRAALPGGTCTSS